MPTRWKITYSVPEGMYVTDQPAVYPAFGVSFQYGDKGRLVAIKHELDHDLGEIDAESVDEVIKASEAKLSLIFEAFTFSRGVRLPLGSRNAERIGTPSGEGDEKSVGRVHHSCDAILQKRIGAPAEIKLTGADHRLLVWLRIANESRDTVLDAQALRHYYLILEEIYGKTRPTQIEKVKLARDFLSHPSVCNPNLLAFLASEFGGRSVTKFDPFAADHGAFVKKWRAQARVLVESELQKLL